LRHPRAGETELTKLFFQVYIGLYSAFGVWAFVSILLAEIPSEKWLCLRSVVPGNPDTKTVLSETVYSILGVTAKVAILCTFATTF